MRLKTIKEGARFIRICNPSDKTLRVFHKKKLLTLVSAQAFIIIDSKSFFCEFPPMDFFPELNFYANFKPIINVVYAPELPKE